MIHFRRIIFFLFSFLYNLIFYLSNNFLNIFRKEVDAYNLAIIRIIFGALMIIDINHERAFNQSYNLYMDPNDCRFPVLKFLKPLSPEYMCLLYFLMLLGAIGLMLGLWFRLSTILYTSIFWYIILLDKSHLNNHSYLFALISLIFSISDANKVWSIDAYRSKQKITKILFWQYFLLRFQISLVYFYAGIKKIDYDWIGGYSMRNLSEKWIFTPFRIVLGPEHVDLYVVHWCGFLIDISVGIMLIFSKSRIIGYLLCFAFNFMNSTMFEIGMFPYVMIGLLPIYSSPNWPMSVWKTFIDKITYLKRKNEIYYLTDKNKDKSVACNEAKIKPHDIKNVEISASKTIDTQKINRIKSNIMIKVFVITYVLIQIFLPFSHFITPGYNTWTNGFYGYSWDMMVHHWRIFRKRIIIVENNRRRYLDDKWSPNNRWTHHADMAKEFVDCVVNRLKKEHNIIPTSVYLDIWVSLNGRFAQRIYDPNVDIMNVKWSTTKKPPWVLPLLTEFSKWRRKIRDMENLQNSQNILIKFFAQFPGTTTNNFIDPELVNVSLTVLKGFIHVRVEDGYERVLGEGDSCALPSNKLHHIVSLKTRPSSYYYTYINKTSPMPKKNSSEESKIVRYINKWKESFRILSFSLMKITRRLLDGQLTMP